MSNNVFYNSEQECIDKCQPIVDKIEQLLKESGIDINPYYGGNDIELEAWFNDEHGRPTLKNFYLDCSI